MNGGSIDGVVIGAASAAAGTFAALVGTSLNVSDGNITNVGDIALDTISADDGSSFAFGSNWTAASRTCADLGTVTTADINGGSLDGVVIGASSQAKAQVTALTASAGAKFNNGFESLETSLFGAGGYNGGNGATIDNDGTGNHGLFAKGRILTDSSVTADSLEVGGGYGSTGSVS